MTKLTSTDFYIDVGPLSIGVNGPVRKIKNKYILTKDTRLSIFQYGFGSDITRKELKEALKYLYENRHNARDI